MAVDAESYPMRFKGFMLDAIENGTKTVTRRLVRTDKCPYAVGRIYSATNRPRWTASGTKSNAKGGWKAIPIKIVSIRREFLYMTEDEAKMEGFSEQPGITAKDKFYMVWGAIHGVVGFEKDWPDVWRIEFKRVPESWS